VQALTGRARGERAERITRPRSRRGIDSRRPTNESHSYKEEPTCAIYQWKTITSQGSL
jgi:hypothetical protein